ncbi:hypothetical protein [Archaeoglobus veneficus]|uniref:hypothetical protein n=1 Tax=Archaeoglobus veneficus TaxID=58290 RepID=UPI00064FFBDF|nr:hypothetical protein [Archaeoglobus veneficus]
MEYVVVDKRMMTTTTAILCVALLLGAIGAPMMEFTYWCDHGTLPSFWDVFKWVSFTIIGEYGTAWTIAAALVDFIWDLSEGEIAQAGGDVIAATADVLLEAFKLVGLGLSWQWRAFWYAAQFIWWL